MTEHHQPAATELNRRTALTAIGGIGLAFAALGQRTALAQDATPPATGGPTGVSMVGMGVGMPTVSPDHELTLRRTIIAPGGQMPNHTHPGSMILYVESGTFGYTLLEETMQVVRAVTEGTPAPAEEGVIGTEVILEPGDWLFMDESRDASRNAGDDDVVLVVAALTVIGEPFSTFLDA